MIERVVSYGHVYVVPLLAAKLSTSVIAESE